MFEALGRQGRVGMARLAGEECFSPETGHLLGSRISPGPGLYRPTAREGEACMDIVHHGIQGQRPPMSRRPSFGTQGAKHRDVKPERETLVGAPLPAPFPEVYSEESLGVGELGFQSQAM